jgi:hypothetical protein
LFVSVVPISVLLTFNRLKTMSVEANTVARALLESRALTMSADMTKVRRNAPLPATDDSRACMVYAKGFPFDVTLERLEAWGPNSDVARYVVRRDPKDATRRYPSIFLEMKTPGAAIALVKQHAETPLEFEGKALSEVKLREDYYREKREEKASSRDRSKMIREEDLMEGFRRDWLPGALVKLTGLPEDTDGDGLSDALKNIAQVKYVELIESQTDAAILRTSSAADAATVLTAIAELASLQGEGKELDSEVEGSPLDDAGKRAGRKGIADACKGVVPKAALLGGDEERLYWERVLDLQAARYRARQLQKLKKTERDVIPSAKRAEKRPAEDEGASAKRAKTDE